VPAEERRVSEPKLSPACKGDAICGVCGRETLRIAEDGSLDCLECFGDWPSASAYFAAIEARERLRWRSEPVFFRDVLREPEAELAVFRVAKSLLALGVAPEIVEDVSRAVNWRRASLRHCCMPEGAIEEVLLRAAEVVAAGRHLPRRSTPAA
jgi:hypothetical protein